MKKIFTLMAMALLTFMGAYAQDGQEETPAVVYTKTFYSVLADAKSIVESEHYTTGRSDLKAAIETAEKAVTEGPGEESDDVLDNSYLRDQLIELQAAIDAFVFANQYADATEKIANPSFDKDNNNATAITSWTVSNFKQNRRSVSYTSTRVNKDNLRYTLANFVEQWAATSVGQLSGSGKIEQVVSKLPAGHYRLTADILVVNQKDADDNEEAVGVQLYANESVREIGLTDVKTGTNATAFSVDFDIAEGEDATIGLRFDNVNFNWMAWDNVTLFFIGDPDIYNSVVDAEKLVAAKEALNASLTAAREALAREDAPLYHSELEAAITNAETSLEGVSTYEEAETAKSTLDAEITAFNNNNKHYTNLKTAIGKAEELVASGELKEGTEDYQTAIGTAKEALSTAITSATDEAVSQLQAALTDLQTAELAYRIANASYANPANVITNGAMNNTDGWDILVPGANPGLHINTSGNVTNFSKPFMECWVKDANYGQENYARQTITALPNGLELPKGLYVLQAAALATRQDQADLEVSGVKLKLADEEVAVHTGNGVGEIYRLEYEKTTAGGELTIGLFIDESTDANWIAWDEVQLQYVGDADKYYDDYAAAVLGESLGKLKEAVAKANALIKSVDPNGIEIEYTDLVYFVESAQEIIDNPTSKEATKENIEEIIKNIETAYAEFRISGVLPKDGNSFDFTSFIENAEFDTAAGEEWDLNGESDKLPDGTDCAYWWYGGSTTFALTQDFSQTLSNLPAGNYLLDVKAAIRVDMNYSTANYTAENLPNYMTSCKVYANEESADVHPFFYEDEAKGLTLESMLAMTNDYDYRHGNGTLIDYMLKETDYFHSYVPFSIEEGEDITVGFHLELPGRSGQMPFIDYFHLAFYGKQDVEEVTSIASPEMKNVDAPKGIYNLAGQRVDSNYKGIVIKNGKKVLVK